ncbi:hypothetical protein [uncultured Legionella sp.]|uniref:hypothetical protein n=1 Tax=uncultured Legionella sp. TaxID=210934 RepID=UPI002609E330|nr:hypothetical protein [uncultured Legionella sp.]
MENTNNKRTLIYSVNELRPSLRIKVQRTAHLVGFLALLVVSFAFLAFGIYPKGNDLFFLCGDWLLMIGIPLASYGMGYLLGWNSALWDLGFVLFQGYSVGDGSNHHMHSGNDTTHAYHGHSYSSSVSINPSSGRPMSGSSGVDTYGNPYGTRSW